MQNVLCHRHWARTKLWRKRAEQNNTIHTPDVIQLPSVSVVDVSPDKGTQTAPSRATRTSIVDEHMQVLVRALVKPFDKLFHRAQRRDVERPRFHCVIARGLSTVNTVP